MKNKKIKKSDKVSVVLAFRIMQEVYSPIFKFYKEMKRLGHGEYILLTHQYIIDAMNHLQDEDIDHFIESKYTYTLNHVSNSIVRLYDLYYADFQNSYFGALVKVFQHLDEDLLNV